MEKDQVKAPLAGVIYGGIVYWGVLAGSLIVIIGSVLAFLGDNYVPASYWLSTVWQGESVSQIWQGATGSLPLGHWYLSLFQRDGAHFSFSQVVDDPVTQGPVKIRRDVFYRRIHVGQIKSIHNNVLNDVLAVTRGRIIDHFAHITDQPAVFTAKEFDKLGAFFLCFHNPVDVIKMDLLHRHQR